MTELERSSFAAIRRYQSCLKPYIRKAKTNPQLSDVEVEALGYKCKTELNDAATKRERFWSSENRIKPEDELYYAPTKAGRVRLQEIDLASIAWCELRPCHIID